ncbi:thioredoxin family protein [Lysinibacillus halotolerans]|uniref:Thioredoxin n=1 Tax=Lysinibacillus halotolerans TaxID=1368476 RepID=A0A3M8H847_9BACI|nr:thioredoxin family protein [Lysinibacillus halotolerans]RNC98280.1 thioredoxin [Lysinibacillus halotolerans]
MEEWTIETWEQQKEQNSLTAFYLYTPMCGTCAVASKMLDVIETLLPELSLGKANINFLEQLAFDYQIESVPCLLISRDNQVEKVYAFQSVPYLYEKLKK